MQKCDDSRILGGGEWLWWLPWVLALLAGVWAVASFRFGSADPDSEFYAFLVKQINDKPWPQWIAPDWMWRQGIPAGDVVRDHLVGHLIPPVLLSRLGYPSGQAIYAWNLLYSLGCFLGFVALAKEYFPAKAARALTWGLLLLPISFLYRVRANHEQFVLLCVIWGALGGAKMRHSFRWIGLVALATHLCFLAKGVVFVMVPAAAGLALVAHFFDLTWKRITLFAALLVVSTLSVGLTALAYEWAFREVTGREFFAAYWEIQILSRSVYINETHPVIVRKLINFTYYIATSFWYSLPWTLSLLGALWSGVRFLKGGKGRLVSTWGAARVSLQEILARPQVQGQIILLGVALEYIFLFSASNRLAGRYIFPTFFFLGAGAFLLAWENWPWLRRLGAVVERGGVHRISAALWALFVLMTVIFQNAGD